MGDEKEKKQEDNEEGGGGRVLRKRKKLLIDPLILGMTVKWGKHPSAGLKRVQFRLEITVELSKGSEYKYDNVRYRQQAYDYTHILSGTHSGHKDETQWSVPEPYTPDWDEGGTPGTLVFVDQPGYTENKGIAEDDDIYYIFGAKWAVWVKGTDQLLKLGPFYGTVRGAGNDRVYKPDSPTTFFKKRSARGWFGLYSGSQISPTMPPKPLG
jgi:hypothetical protein